jgi:hypothetical protein
MAVRLMPLPGLGDGRDGPPQLEDAAHDVVLGRLPDDGQAYLSALLLQGQLGLSRYETAWIVLHKLRRAMVNAARGPLQGKVELDETWVGGTQSGLRGSRQLRGRKAALVLVAVERRGRGPSG